MASAVVVPSNGTWFDTLRRSFVDVPVNADEENAISTTEFLEAAESLTTLFDVLGSAAFTPVKNDILGNVRKLRERQLSAMTKSETLQALVVNEIKESKHTAAEGLLWLVRGLDFTAQAMRNNINSPDEELSTSFRSAYRLTLRPYHSFLVKPVFAAAMSATPYRKTFYEKLAKDQERGLKELREWLDALEAQVAILKEFQTRKQAQW